MRLLKLLRGDKYVIHQLLWGLFPGFPEGTSQPFLYRQEFEKEQLRTSDLRRRMPLFYLVSEQQPVPVDGLLDVESKDYDPRLEAGQRLGFELRVNPVVSRKTEGRKRSAKHDVLMDAKFTAGAEGITDGQEIEARMQRAAVDWLAARAERSGFRLERPECVEVSGYRQHALRKGKAKPIRFSSVDLAGLLVVEDPDVLKKVLFCGLGRSKSFGCGMLMVRLV
jgi:CRISPR system Cascade subunit CasE